jgi:quercetin dioxygenase-like cupin family protein
MPIRISASPYLSLLLLASIASFAPIALPAFAQLPAPLTYGPPANSAVLPSTVVDWDALPVKPNAGGEQRPVFDNPTPVLPKLEVHISTLNPGQMSHPPHRHPWEEMLLIRDGNVEATIHGEKRRAGPGALIFFASNDPHNLVNIGTTPATYYVINFDTDRVLTASDKPAAEQAVPGMLPSSIIDCNSMPTTPTATGAAVTVLNSPTLTFALLHSHITTVDVGKSTAPGGVDPGDELLIVKTGSIELTINGVASRINQSSLAYMAPNDKRFIRNIGTVPASYQVIKVVSDKSPK